MSIALGLRPSVVTAKRRLAEGRAKLRLRHDKGSPSAQICGAMSDLFDSIVLDLYEAALADLGQQGEASLASQVALVPHAGYGRRDVAPYSDVDLMILHAPAATEFVKPLASRLTRDLFDTGLVLGHAVRTPEEACKLALADAQICTSLIESRFLAGSVSLVTRFASRFQQQVRRRSGSTIAAIEQARREERAQCGETIYLLEPNIKRSRGGLRDIQLLRWVGFVCYGSSEPDNLHLCGALAKDELKTLRQATDFLLRLRNEMHFFAGKSSDLLDRAEQVRLAGVLGCQGGDGLLPVEEFMREYFRRTQAVSRIVDRFVANAKPGSKLAEAVGTFFSHQMEGDFRVGPSTIWATRSGLQKLRGGLEEVLRLTDLANRSDKRIAHGVCEVIRQSVPGFSEEITPSAAQRFLSLISQPAPHLGSLLRFLHDLGVLEKIIPGFTHARCLLQFNEYHKFTVDEHCLRAVERATEFLHDPGPLGNTYRHIKQKRLLHLALLIHDLGKGYAEDHSDVGLRIAAETAARLRLNEREAEILKFLVHKHLMMSHLAFRRDTSDEQLIVRFAVDVGSPEVLELLFVLTAADLAAVGPGVLNNWKVEVLNSLFQRTMQHLAGGNQAGTSSERLREAKQAVLAQAVDDSDHAWFQEQIESLPAGYLLARAPDQIIADLRQLKSLEPGKVAASARFLPESRAVEYTIATQEEITPGVFHKLTGALTGKGLQILSAEINTLAKGLVLDRFLVHDPDFADQPPAARLEAVKESLVGSLTGGTAPTFRKIWRSGRASSSIQLSPLPTQVRADNSTSERFTILDIFAADRMGLLYTISRTLFELELSVWVAKIGTYLDQVVDVFYVTDLAGRKIESEQRLQEIRARLLEVIAAMEQPEREVISA